MTLPVKQKTRAGVSKASEIISPSAFLLLSALVSMAIR